MTREDSVTWDGAAPLGESFMRPDALAGAA